MEHQGYEGERGRYADADLGADRTSERFGKWKSTWQDTDLYAKRILPCDRSGLDKTVRVQMFVTSVCDDRSPVSVLRLEERSDPKQAWCSCGVISLAIAAEALINEPPGYAIEMLASQQYLDRRSPRSVVHIPKGTARTRCPLPALGWQQGLRSNRAIGTAVMAQR